MLLYDFFVGVPTVALVDRFSAGADMLVNFMHLDKGVPQEGGGGTKSSARVPRAVWAVLYADDAGHVKQS